MRDRRGRSDFAGGASLPSILHLHLNLTHVNVLAKSLVFPRGEM